MMGTCALLWLITVSAWLFVRPLCQAYPCGPDSKCSCATTNESTIIMDCRERTLHLSEICGICNILTVEDENEITSLDLSNLNILNGNSNFTIPDYCFKGHRCFHLKHLSIANNEIRDLGDFSFSNITELRTLNMDDNKLIINGTFANPAIFTHLQNLEKLQLQGNTFTQQSCNAAYLSNILPWSFPALKELYLDGPEMVTFGSNFQGFQNLTRLDFTGTFAQCSIIALQNHTFANLVQLQDLNLGQCNLSFVDAGAFEGLPNLVHLNLSNNEGLGFVSLRNVSYGLQFSRKLKVLNYSKIHKQFGLSTELKRCDVWYLQNTTITELYLDNNRMALIERNALLLFPASIEVISAERNMLNFGPYVVQVGCLRNLKRAEVNEQYVFGNPEDFDKEVDIVEKARTTHDSCDLPMPAVERKNCKFLNDNHFKIGDIYFPPKNPSWPVNLKTLNFRGSNLPIVNIPKDNESRRLPMPGNLESLDSSYNNIGSINVPYVILSSLKFVNLSNNFASELEPDSLQSVPNLIRLDASNNFLGKALSADTKGQIFSHVKHLRELNLSANLITTFPNFSALENLNMLNLASNSLSEVPATLSDLKNLVHLDLRQNTISTLPLNVLKQVEKYAQSVGQNASIDLSNNSLEISCENVKFLNWILKHPNHFKNPDTYTYHLKGKHFVLRLEELKTNVKSLRKNCKSYTALIITSTVAILGFMFCILGGLIYRYRWRLRYLYYLAKARYHGYDHISDDSTEYKYDAFISYAEEDYRFIKDEVIVELERNRDFELCLHQRDFLPGNYIAENILQAIKDSRMIVIVLTNAFLKSKWCIYEYNMARMESIYSRNGQSFIVCIMYDDIDNGFLSPDLIETLDSETFLKYPLDEQEKPYFWEMLGRSLST